MSKLSPEDIEFNRKVALRVKELRLKVNKNQSKFAEAHFIDRQMINRWENTKDKRGISIHTINKFCKMLNIQLKDFFDSELFYGFQDDNCK
jgi:transcriptional regulator with XRE-family HTH domain